VKIEIPTDDETWRTIADGTRHADGTYRWEIISEAFPTELLTAFERHLMETQPIYGTWFYVGYTKYKVGFTSLQIR
jgi:hypothetical protein